MKRASATAGRIMTEKLETINILNTAQEAAVKMAGRNVSSLAVTDDNGKAIGILTERDLARRVCTTEKSSSSVTVQEIMSSPVITVDADTPVDEAADIMVRKKVRHLLVAGRDGRPAGIITPTDFAASLKEGAEISKGKLNEVILQVLREHRRYL